MALNCKPGDLAVVVRSHPGIPPGSVGKIVRCIELHPLAISAFSGDIVENAWWVELNGETMGLLARLGCPDCCLRPIRDPGADAVDEMVAKVGPAPMTLTEVREWAHG